MKRPIVSLLFIFCSLILLNRSYSQCDWQSVGQDNDMFFMQDSSYLYYPAITNDNIGTQYVAWCDGEFGKRISVKRYVDKHWSYVGDPGFSVGAVDYIRLATDGFNKVYVAYKDATQGNKVTVQFFNGVNWSVLGNPGIGADTIIDFDFTVDQTTNVPVLFLKDSINKTSVLEYNGSAWSMLGVNNFAGAHVYEPKVSSYNGVVYVNYIINSPFGIHVKQFQGGNWIALGNIINNINSMMITKVKLDNNSVPHFAFTDGPNSYRPAVMYLNGATWSYLGGAFTLGGTSFYGDFVFDSSNNCYLSCSNTSNSRSRIYKYSGVNWQMVAEHYSPTNVYIPSQYNYFKGMSINKTNDHLFLINTERTASPLMGWKDFGVMEYDGVKVLNTGAKSATGPIKFGTGAYSAYFDLDNNGTPYVIYSDSTNGDKASVKKYFNNDWVSVGSLGFSTAGAEFVRIAFDSNNTPYAAFRVNNNDVMVYQYNGSAWTQVGATIINTYGLDLAVNPLTNEPYVFYADNSNGLRGVVKRFDGSNWVQVGANVNTGSCAYPNIDFHNNGTLYAGFSDNAQGTKAVVKIFNGSVWTAVGAATISSAQAHQLRLFVHANGNLYIAYTDQSNGYKAVCQMYNGVSWSQVGSFVNGGYTSDVDLAVDPSGNIFVYYNEQYLNYYPGTVKRFFNNAWVAVGKQYITNGQLKSNQIRISPSNGLPYIGSIAALGVLNSNYPLGFWVKSLPCNFGSALMGNVNYDVNSNCAYDANETRLANQSVLLSQGANTQTAFTDNGGNYYFTNASPGTYTVAVTNLTNGYVASCAISQPHSTTINNGALTVDDFPLACTPSFDFVASNINRIGNFWPGQTVYLKSYAPIIKTVCSAAPTPGTIQLILPPCLKYDQDTNLVWQPSSVQLWPAGDTITYSVADVYNHSYWLQANLLTRAKICTTATVLDTFCVTMIVQALGDNQLNNNIYTTCIPAMASYDPNYKEVSPKGVGSAGFISPSPLDLVYTVHFQNTGNAPAVNIFIKDTIDSDLDITSLQILSSSHAMANNSLVNGVMTFNFPNIMLPDSATSPMGSQGYVTYSIKMKPGLLPLTQITNKAYIYFDYNAPIITNTTLNTIENPAGINQSFTKSNSFLIYPNPASNGLNIINEQEFNYLKIHDITGRLVYYKQLNNVRGVELNISELKSGIYLLEIGDNAGRKHARFVKE